MYQVTDSSHADLTTEDKDCFVSPFGYRKTHGFSCSCW